MDERHKQRERITALIGMLVAEGYDAPKAIDLLSNTILKIFAYAYKNPQAYLNYAKEIQRVAETWLARSSKKTNPDWH